MDDESPVGGPKAVHNFRVEQVAAPLRQRVVSTLRTAIAAGHFRAGQRLTERDLCELTGVSRTLVREAVRQLETEGLITVVPNRGPVVARLTPLQAEGLYQVRRELEGLAAELFAQRASAADLSALRQAHQRLEAALHGSDVVERLDAKNAFYDCLIRGAGNEALGQTLNQLNSRVTVLRATSLQAEGRWASSLDELGEVVRALEARDAALARKLAMRHVENAAAVVLDVLRAEAAGREAATGT